MDDRLLPSSSSRRMVSFKGATQVHVTTLDEVVSVNSFFTIAVFLGLSFSSTKAADLETDCPVGPDAVKYLLLYEVLAFASFLFSSLVAHGLKLYIIFANSNLIEESQAAEINNRLLRIGMLASAIGSVAGTIFLMLSMISLIELRVLRLPRHSSNLAAGPPYFSIVCSTNSSATDLTGEAAGLTGLRLFFYNVYIGRQHNETPILS
ncbi:hypothetical protein SELMODRAFT_407244 [Selaginella moellendorffii]|uniref:Uncharacterized protein n=1 Tax=Selaginella moellendorffii TaxID=88036 RepID=D8R4E2_SELML|nr:hypothetical protein SELMODRAFT_407244 [Selaginella moellendorffii]